MNDPAPPPHCRDCGRPISEAATRCGRCSPRARGSAAWRERPPVTGIAHVQDPTHLAVQALRALNLATAIEALRHLRRH